MIISLDTEKSVHIIQHRFMIETEEIIIEGTYLDKTKVVYDKLITNVKPNGEKLIIFPLKSVMRLKPPTVSILIWYSV